MSNWGGANRPITSNKLGIPNKAEGADGDLQIRQTQLGAKLFGKIGGRWYDNPFSIDGTTKIGTNLSNHLAITREGIEVYEDNKKVASFGNTMNVGNWNINSTSIYTGTEDHSGYTANAGDITLYSDGSDSSIHAKEFYIGTDGKFYSTGGTLGDNTILADDIVTTDSIANNAITDALLNFGSQNWTTDLEIRGTAWDAVIWDKGTDADATMTFGDGTTKTLTKDTSTGLTASKTYFVYASSADAVVRLSLTYTDAIGADKILLGHVVTGVDAATEGDSPSIFPFRTNALTISATAIAANSITANHISGNTITIAELATIADIALSGQIGLTGTNSTVAIGTGNSVLGANNVLIGIDAGDSASVGATNNVYIGHNAGKGMNKGLYNIFLGSSCGISMGTGAQTGSSLNRLFNVGIGFEALKLLDASTSGGSIGNTCIGGKAGDAITSGSENICIGPDSDGAATLVKQIAIGSAVVCDTAETIRIGDSADYLFYDFSGGGGAEAVTSDVRVKKNIVDTDIGLNFINALRPVKYIGKNKHDYPGELFQGGVNTLVEDSPRGEDPTAIRDGFIGQEVKQVMDDLDITFSGWRQNNSSRQMLSYSTFVVPLVKAVQELSAQVNTMQTEINNLKSE